MKLEPRYLGCYAREDGLRLTGSREFYRLQFMDVKQSLLNLSASRLKKAAKLKERIDALNDELANLLMEITPAPIGAVIRKRRQMSAAARKKISDAAKARWAKVRAGKK